MGERLGREKDGMGGSHTARKLGGRPAGGGRGAGGGSGCAGRRKRDVRGGVRGKQAEGSLADVHRDERRTKAKILEALRQTSQDVAGALRAQPVSADRKSLELAVTFIEHNSEHYGQLAAYARLMGLVPPASRG